MVGRFIPVYTGNTEAIPTIGEKTPVYPCVYREHPAQPTYQQRQYGLSLCIQGTRAIYQREEKK